MIQTLYDTNALIDRVRAVIYFFPERSLLITTDDKLLNKDVDGVRLINPIDFVRKEASHDS
jgi:hypothetical protein